MGRDKLFLISFIAVSLLHLIALLANWISVAAVTKPLIVLLLVGYYLASSANRSSLFIRALFFCWSGDILLLFTRQEELYFIMGLFAFLVGHILYIIAYRQHRINENIKALLVTQKIRYSLPIVLAGTGLIVILFPMLGDLKLPVLIYGIVLIMMVMTALFRFGKTNNTSFWLVFGGAVLFMISDSLLAINKFYSSFALSGFLIMLTYIGAQYLIVKGIIKHSVYRSN